MNRRRTLMAAFVGGFVAAALLFFGMGHMQTLKGDNQAPVAPAKTVTDLVKQVTRGIGRVDVMRKYQNKDAKTGKVTESWQSESGTCFIIRCDRAGGDDTLSDIEMDVVTNNHIFNPMTPDKNWTTPPTLFVTVYGVADTTSTIVGTDTLADLAVIRVRGKAPTQDLPTALPWADPDSVQVGDDMITIGYARDIRGRPTVTRGIVSALRRAQPTSGSNQGIYADLLQSDCNANHGNSGGPTLNMRGEVTGVHTYQYAPGVSKDSGGNTQVDVTFGIFWSRSSRTARPFVEQIVRTGKVTRLNLGANGVTLSDDDVRFFHWPRGVRLIAVNQGSLAAQAGLKVGDMIIGLGSAAQRPQTPSPAQESNTVTLGDLNDALGLRSGDASIWVRFIRPADAWLTALNSGQFPVYTEGQTYTAFLR